MQNNSTIEKYCYDNDSVNCEIYGGLYQWDEMMQYVLQEGTKGICPNGWHIPSDSEWKILEGNTDSQYLVNDAEWDKNGSRGFDVGKNLKTTYGWNNNGNGIDLYFFSTLPGGFISSQYSDYLGENSYHWSSTYYGSRRAWSRYLYSNSAEMGRGSYYKEDARSVRCIKD